MAKEIRFGELVKHSGKPQVITLWTNPKRDRSFAKAVKENRVLTVIQKPTGKRKDFGQIGFHQKTHASYFVFPKPLPKEPLRVIGIKYDLVEQGTVSDPVRTSSNEEPKKRSAKSSAKPVRKRKEFQVLFRRSAVIETVVTVQSASSVSEARRLATKQMASEPFDLAKAVIRNEVLNVTEG
jgi:hypothetical protein